MKTRLFFCFFFILSTFSRETHAAVVHFDASVTGLGYEMYLDTSLPERYTCKRFDTLISEAWYAGEIYLVALVRDEFGELMFVDAAACAEVIRANIVLGRYYDFFSIERVFAIKKSGAPVNPYDDCLYVFTEKDFEAVVISEDVPARAGLCALAHLITFDKGDLELVKALGQCKIASPKRGRSPEREETQVTLVEHQRIRTELSDVCIDVPVGLPCPEPTPKKARYAERVAKTVTDLVRYFMGRAEAFAKI